MGILPYLRERGLKLSQETSRITHMGIYSEYGGSNVSHCIAQHIEVQPRFLRKQHNFTSNRRCISYPMARQSEFSEKFIQSFCTKNSITFGFINLRPNQ